MVLSSVAASVSAIISAFALVYTYKSNKTAHKNERKSSTITAYRILQDEVLDKLVDYKKADFDLVIENIDDNTDCKTAYNDTRTLLARCECFSVAVLEGIYDFDILYKISGKHLLVIYRKVKPIIELARERGKTELPYSSFEKLCKKIRDKEARQQ